VTDLTAASGRRPIASGIGEASTPPLDDGVDAAATPTTGEQAGEGFPDAGHGRASPWAATRYTRPRPSTFSVTTARPALRLTLTEMKARVVCGSQPVTAWISAMVAPSGRFNSAATVASAVPRLAGPLVASASGSPAVSSGSASAGAGSYVGSPPAAVMDPRSSRL
jgi:hypothetical protein